ncbi:MULTISPECIES: HAD family hydrolase [unclassified Undibacterium]|uniref:histidinol-phosphatase n=2 Tax=Pseudomonadota TaxID=1224 RepID=UPI002AC96B4F|nr:MULTISPECIES: HAD family hydrolase [unclassified Undibacterium]MEB0139921.1 HAD family hydrolase [Undibacterium sp. CCC2.1]MEB0171810.1 HAD family hydrolase [Undibacterium sp. CCC1.1]MEB0175626.1 HAD family hydrolase [Undibacterium sp. CCC3.4]MEB0216208.1 HAD family hydrolase [Undibacterium sp. 5I2]WPX44101.1 HAD family hydrolase [Undibacterium sp. CCC3.4]
MRDLALFDLDHTLLPIDSDYEWGQFLCRVGAVDAALFAARNATFFAQYQAGTLDPVEYLEFALGTLAQFPRPRLDQLHAQFMQEVIQPALLPAAFDLLQRHRDEDDLIAIITATNRFVTAPIAAALGVTHLLAAEPEGYETGTLSGKLLGVPTSGRGKVIHLHDWLASRGTSLEAFPRSYFYSDSHNDIPLLEVVTNPVATNPNASLRAHALAHGWPQINLYPQ